MLQIKNTLGGGGSLKIEYGSINEVPAIADIRKNTFIEVESPSNGTATLGFSDVNTYACYGATFVMKLANGNYAGIRTDYNSNCYQVLMNSDGTKISETLMFTLNKIHDYKVIYLTQNKIALIGFAFSPSSSNAANYLNIAVLNIKNDGFEVVFSKKLSFSPTSNNTHCGDAILLPDGRVLVSLFKGASSTSSYGTLYFLFLTFSDSDVTAEFATFSGTTSYATYNTRICPNSDGSYTIYKHTGSTTSERNILYAFVFTVEGSTIVKQTDEIMLESTKTFTDVLYAENDENYTHAIAVWVGTSASNDNNGAMLTTVCDINGITIVAPLTRIDNLSSSNQRATIIYLGSYNWLILTAGTSYKYSVITIIGKTIEHYECYFGDLVTHPELFSSFSYHCVPSEIEKGKYLVMGLYSNNYYCFSMVITFNFGGVKESVNKIAGISVEQINSGSNGKIYCLE